MDFLIEMMKLCFGYTMVILVLFLFFKRLPVLSIIASFIYFSYVPSMEIFFSHFHLLATNLAYFLMLVAGLFGLMILGFFSSLESESSRKQRNKYYQEEQEKMLDAHRRATGQR